MGPKELSKAEKLAKKKEEAERKAKEEEEARLQKEKEEAERNEKERIEREARELSQRKVRNEQLTELDSVLEGHEVALQEEREAGRVKSKWSRYMQCDGSPDPSLNREINMYLAMLREDSVFNDFDMILREGELLLKLIDELNFHLTDTTNEELSQPVIEQYSETIKEMQDVLKMRLDLGTFSLLCNATELADIETMNLERVIANDYITLCIWGNLSKNPRVKLYEFESMGLVFEIPKILTLSDCAIRALFTKYDHLSQQSKSYYAQIKVKEPEPVEEEMKVEEDAGEEEEEEEEEEELVRLRSDSETSEDMSALLAAKPAPAPAAVEEEAEEEEVEPDYEIKSPEPVEYEDFDGDDDMVDLRAYHIVGGVIYFNLLQMPPQPKTAGTWTITQLVQPPELHYLEYAVEQPKVGVVDENAEAEEQPKEKKKDLDRPPISVTVRIPSDSYFSDMPEVVHWDHNDKCWRQSGFLDKVYNEKRRVLTFRTTLFGTLAFMQDAHINMPFQSWELRPRGQDHAQLTIIAAVNEVEIQIKGGQVCLTQPNPETRPEFAHIVDKWMNVSDLIREMRRSGINIFPAEDSFKYVQIPDKSPAIEKRTYQQMALVASSMAFSWSHWNVDVNDRDKIIVQASEHIKDEPLLEEDWSLVMIDRRNAVKLKMTEISESFSDELCSEDAEFTADLYHLSLDISSPDGQNRIHNTDRHFIDCAAQLLRATRVIPFS